MRAECGARDAAERAGTVLHASIPFWQVTEQLQCQNWPIVEGPIMRTGATQTVRSVYVRDPDLSLIEISAFA